MLVKNVTRGNAVVFESTFLDADNAHVSPVDPTLTVSYKANNETVAEIINLTQTVSNTWTGTWNSSNADVGIAQWHIAGGTGVLIAEDGEFRIIANAANPGNP